LDKQTTILVADDDPTTLIVITKLLERSGYDVIAVNDGLEAIESLEISPPDVIVTDMNMPNLDGIEVIRIVKSVTEYEDIPVLILTAEDSPEILRTAFELGATDYIRKPISELELLARISAAVRLKVATDQRIQKEKELEANVVAMRKDLEAAGEVQRSMLPKTNVMIAGIEVAWHFHPSDDVGGDILNFFPLNNHQVAFYILDVSGHGVPSALFAVSVNSMLLQNTRRGGLLIDHEGNAKPPHEVVHELNMLFQMDMDSQKYFTVTYAVLDTENRTIQYTQAGQTPTLHCVNNACEYWHDGDLPVGMIPYTDFTTYTKELKAGSRLYLYSDGIVEAFNNNEEQFGYDRLSQSLQSQQSGTLTESINHMVNDLEHWIVGNANQDDITILGIELVHDVKTARITVSSSLEAVRTLCATVKDVVMQVSNDQNMAAFIELAIAEAGNNIVQHGYGFDNHGEIRLEAKATEDYIEVCLIDFAPAYDPLAKQDGFEEWDFDSADEFSAGLGVNIMRTLMADATYERVDDMNRLTLRRSLKED
jgi:sigma-B regulation protein RsbU (phosphoserine phosphatase)